MCILIFELNKKTSIQKLPIIINYIAVHPKHVAKQLTAKKQTTITKKRVTHKTIL